MQPSVFKILTPEQWREFLAAQSFPGSPDDVRDGFIHLSAASQLRGTLKRHFLCQTELMLIEVDVAILGAGLRYEVSRGGERFPHFYGALPMPAVRRIWSIELRDGDWNLPAELGV